MWRPREGWLYFGDGDAKESLIFDRCAPVCYLTIYRESAIRNIFEGPFVIAWQGSALSGCFSIHLCQGLSVTAGVYPLFLVVFFVRF